MENPPMDWDVATEINSLQVARDDKNHKIQAVGWLWDVDSELLDYHPNIMTEDGDGHWQGHTTLLDYVIAHGRLRENVARKFARQICSALAYCHHNKIAHRDITLNNILVSPTGDAKLTNFHLSAVYDPLGHLDTFYGTSHFPAPEIITGTPYVGPEVDVWGFGTVLYILVCGRVPFDDIDIFAVREKVLRGVVGYPSRISAECRNILSRMLVTDPALRAPLSEIISHRWMVRGSSGLPETYILACRGKIEGGRVTPRPRSFNFSCKNLKVLIRTLTKWTKRGPVKTCE
ncbi:kinase-like domain-containing protein [Mycena vulgaris]|nr:kinase-like domain-containing protein [Mycena vulgaris]